MTDFYEIASGGLFVHLSSTKSIKAKDAFHESVSWHGLAFALERNEVDPLYCCYGRINSHHFNPISLASLWQIRGNQFRFVVRQQANAAYASLRKWRDFRNTSVGFKFHPQLQHTLLAGLRHSLSVLRIWRRKNSHISARFPSAVSVHHVFINHIGRKNVKFRNRCSVALA